MQFDNLFNGDKVLSDGTNLFLNENWLDILNELKPVLKKAIAKICNGVVGPIFAKFPYNDLFLWFKESNSRQFSKNLDKNTSNTQMKDAPWYSKYRVDWFKVNVNVVFSFGSSRILSQNHAIGHVEGRSGFGKLLIEMLLNHHFNRAI